MLIFLNLVIISEFTWRILVSFRWNLLSVRTVASPSTRSGQLITIFQAPNQPNVYFLLSIGCSDCINGWFVILFTKLLAERLRSVLEKSWIHYIFMVFYIADSPAHIFIYETYSKTDKIWHCSRLLHKLEGNLCKILMDFVSISSGK